MGEPAARGDLRSKENGLVGGLRIQDGGGSIRKTTVELDVGRKVPHACSWKAGGEWDCKLESRKQRNWESHRSCPSPSQWGTTCIRWARKVAWCSLELLSKLKWHAPRFCQTHRWHFHFGTWATFHFFLRAKTSWSRVSNLYQKPRKWCKTSMACETHPGNFWRAQGLPSDATWCNRAKLCRAVQTWDGRMAGWVIYALTHLINRLTLWECWIFFGDRVKTPWGREVLWEMLVFLK